jgi:hypothetical protein
VYSQILTILLRLGYDVIIQMDKRKLFKLQEFVNKEACKLNISNDFGKLGVTFVHNNALSSNNNTLSHIRASLAQTTVP